MKRHNTRASLFIWLFFCIITPAIAANRRGIALPLSRMLAESQWVIDGEIVNRTELPPLVIGANQTNDPIILTNYFAHFKIETILKGTPPTGAAQIILLRVQTTTDNRFHHGWRLELLPGDKFRFFSNALRLNEDGSVEAPVAGIGEIRPEAYHQSLGIPAPDPGGPISGEDEELLKAVAEFAFDKRTGRPLPPPSEAPPDTTLPKPAESATPSTPSDPTSNPTQPMPAPAPPVPAVVTAKPARPLFWWLCGTFTILAVALFAIRRKKS